MTGRLVMGERIGGGDTSTVYRGEYDGIPVAVKVLHAHLASDLVIRNRFEREAEVLSAIRHNNICRVFDVTQVEHAPAIVMELLEGASLEGRTLGRESAATLVRNLAGALAEIHGRGIVHRDIRPEHVLTDANGIPRLIDFGAASVKDLSGLTRSTVYSTRPEFIDPYTWGRGRSLPAQDIYSLGAVMHFVLTGHPPSAALFGSVDEQEQRRLADQLRDAAGSPLTEIVTAMLAAPAQRPRSAAEILQWLDGGIAGARRLSVCLHCSASMPEDAPVCLSCGRAPLQIRRDPTGETLVLRKISEKQEILSPFLSRLRLLSEGTPPEIRLIIGDARLYSRAEQKAGQKLPVRITDEIHPSSTGPLITALQGGHLKEIRIQAYPMSRAPRFKRGPLVRLREGRALPETAQQALRALVGTPDAAHSGGRSGDRSDGRSLRTETRYAVAIALASLAADPSTVHLATGETASRLTATLDNAVSSLEKSFAALATVNLQSLYADLERLEGDATPARELARSKERDRIIRLFHDHADTERKTAALEQRIVAACRLLEGITPDNAVERLTELENTLT